MDINQQIKNILAIYEQSTEEEIRLGKQWYQTAHEIVMYLADKYHLLPSQVAGVIAALSPGTDWHQNIIDAVLLFNLKEKARVSTYGMNKVKALKILGSESERPFMHVRDLLLHKSAVNKTSRFFFNILLPNEDGYVTIDRHAVRICYDEILNGTVILTEKRYLRCELAYVQAAKTLDLMPHQLQAITWLTFRRLFDIPNKNKAIRLDQFVQEKLGYVSAVPF